MTQFKWVAPKEAIRIIMAAQRMKPEITQVMDTVDIVMNMTKLGRPPTEEEQGAMAASIILTLIEQFDPRGQAIIMQYLQKAYYDIANENTILDPTPDTKQPK